LENKNEVQNLIKITFRVLCTNFVAVADLRLISVAILLPFGNFCNEKIPVV